MSLRADHFDQAATSAQRNLLVIAPPGCGKTELLAHRAARRIKDLDAGRRILALTFSNKAKANLNSRLVNVIGVARKRRHVAVHNFHGHAAEIVRSHGATLGITTDFEVPDKHTQDLAIEPYLEGLTGDEYYSTARLISDELRAAKLGPFDDAEVLERLRDTADERTVLVEEQRQRAGTLFFDDLLRHAQRLLRVRQIADLYRNHYAVVIVDEFQDLSLQQLDIVLRTSDRSRTFVGDPLQGIYSYAGARPVEVERILRRVCGEPLGLGTSYRSSPRVLKLLAQVSVQLGGHPLESNNPAEWFEGGVTAGMTFRDGVREAEYIRATAVEIIRRQPGSTIGVICRNGWRRKLVDEAFANAQTACTRWDLAIDNPNVIALIQGAVSRLGGTPSLEDVQREVLSSIPITDINTASDAREAVEQLRELVAQSGSVGAAIAQLRLQKDEEETIPPGVHLLNAHLGKGQQFDWVFIPGFEKGNMPSFQAKSRAELEEEKRVLLVVISRARHGVIVTRASTLISKRGNPWSPDPSPWTDEIREGLSADREGLEAHIDRLPSTVRQGPD